MIDSREKWTKEKNERWQVDESKEGNLLLVPHLNGLMGTKGSR